MTSWSSILVYVALGLVSTDAWASNVHVVDSAASPPSFTQIQPAIQAAAAGDIILVKPGTYDGFTLDGKGLSIIADGGPVSIGPFPNPFGLQEFREVRIRNLPASQRVVIAGLTIPQGLPSLPPFGTPPKNLGAIQVKDCAGQVFLERCTTQGSMSGAGLHATGSSAIVVNRCTLRGAEMNFIYGGTFIIMGDGGAGILASNSSLFIHQSSIIGSRGSGGGSDFSGHTYGASSGGHGFAIDGGFAYLEDCSARGGNGIGSLPQPPFGWCTSSGAGLGIFVGANSPEVHTLDVTTIGGTETTLFCAQEPIAPYFVQTGSLTQYSGNAPTLVAPSALREGQSGTFTITGTPGRIGAYALVVDPSTIFAPIALGTIYIGYSFVVLQTATIPPSGSLSFAFQTPNLPVGLQGVQIYFQSAEITPFTNAVVLGPPATTVLLDHNF